MPRKDIDRLASKKQQLIDRTIEALRLQEAEVVKLLSIGRQQSFRINTLKADESVLDELTALGWKGERFSWCRDGFTVTEGLEAVKASQASQDGRIYIQNAASWLPVLALDPQPHNSVLDICAAPGGKTSHMAALTENYAAITANDNSRPRLAKLQANLNRMGATNITYTLYDARQLSHKLEGQLFDKILLDAPCSGEGMMTLQKDKDFASWSVAHIKRLQQLQRKLIAQAWQLLRPGGTLIYSTCTMAPEENEAVVDYLLRHNDDALIQRIDMANKLPNRSPAVLSWNDKQYSSVLKDSLRLYPSNEVEAFFVCALTKLDSTRSSV